MKTLLQLAITLALCLPALAQGPVAEIPNATLIGSEGITITAINDLSGKPLVATIQYGVGPTWCPAITAPKLPLFVSNSMCFDPLRGTVKTIVAQQQVTSYTVTYVLNGGTVVKTIPALLPLVPTTTTFAFSCPGTIAGTISLVSGVANITAATVTLSPGCAGVKQ